MTTRVKICGLSTKATMQAALDAGADYVGLVFFARSPRNVTVLQARDLARLARGRARIVALVVDADDAALRDIVSVVDPDVIQLHGGETPERTAEIASRFGCAVMKAIKVETADDARAALRYRDAASMILFDAKVSAAPSQNDTDVLPARLPGGNGIAFDWTALDGVRDQMDFMLSGGLDADTVAEAVSQTGAKAVDVSSGVESAPGVKDIERIRQFIKAAKAAPGG